MDVKPEGSPILKPHTDVTPVVAMLFTLRLMRIHNAHTHTFQVLSFYHISVNIRDI